MIMLKTFAGDTHDWDSFLAASGGAGTIYHTSQWLRNISVTHNLDLRRLGIYEGTTLLGIFPLFVKKMVGLTVASSPFHVEDTPYLGFVSTCVNINDLIDALVAYMQDTGLSFVRFVQKETYNDVRSRNLLKVIEKHTHLVNLGIPLEALWQNLQGRCRTAVRKAEKSGVKIEFVTDPAAMAEYYAILTDVYVKQQLIYPHPVEFFSAIFEEYGGRNLYMLRANLNGTTIAGGIFVFDAERAYYLNGASLKEFNNTGVNSLLQWYSLRHAHQLGLKYYDLVGSDQERFGNFKRSFGGNLHTNVCIEITNGYITDTIRRGYPVVKKFAMKYLKKRI